MFGDDIGCKDGIHLPSCRPRIVSALVIGSQPMPQVVLGQYALNRRLARRVFDAEPFQFALNRTRADQTVARLGGRTCSQHSPDGDNCLFDFFGCLVWRSVWRTRMLCKVGLRMGFEFAPPFIQPTRAAPQTATYIAHALAQYA